jgi:hypothetical protein
MTRIVVLFSLNDEERALNRALSVAQLSMLYQLDP